MNILRYRIDIPSNEPRGFTIAIGDASDYVKSYINHSSFFYGCYASGKNFNPSNPPIKMTILECKYENVADCFIADPETWIDGDKAQVLRGDSPFWQLSEVSFSRYSPRLRFGDDGGLTEDLYISKKASINLKFEVYRGEHLSPYIYTMLHDRKDDYGYMVSSLVETINDKPTRLFEFGAEVVHDGFQRHPTVQKEYLIITEFH